MTVAFDDNLLAIWWFALPAQSADMLASLSRRHSPTECELVYRFRYYETEGAWDGLDRKNWYRGVITESPEEAITHLRDVFTAMSAAVRGDKLHECVRGGRSTEEFMKELMRMPFVHVKTGPEAEEWIKAHPEYQPK